MSFVEYLINAFRIFHLGTPLSLFDQKTGISHALAPFIIARSGNSIVISKPLDVGVSDFMSSVLYALKALDVSE